MTLRRFFLVLVALILLFLGWCYWGAIAEPTVREASVRLPGWGGGPPVRVALLSDLHVAGPDMAPERVGRIVAQVNALNPDLVLIAGDFTSDRFFSTHSYNDTEALAPLAGLHARLGTIAVLGNHDYLRGAGDMRAALARAHVRVLANQAVQAGPLVIGGLDDPVTGHNRDQPTYAAMRALSGARILLSHGPDPFATLPPDIGLMLAGHTHCGQFHIPLLYTLTNDSGYGNRYACGFIEDNGRKLIVSAGLGTSRLPLRLLAPPDIWLVTVSGR